MAQDYLLSLETATEVCSISLLADGEEVAKRRETGYIHSSLAAVFVKECLEEANIKAGELAAVAVSIGPGSYTGLRVGLATAKGICYMHDIPLIAVSTLDGLAYRSIQEYPDKDFIHLPMIDARRMEVYVAAYTSAFERALEPQPLILSADSFAQWDQYHGIVLSGNGSTKVEKIEELPSSIIYANDKSDAGDIGKVAFQKLRAGEFADLAYIEPEYIKPPNVTRPKKSLL